MGNTNIPMTQKDYNIYFIDKKDNVSVIDISKISIVSGHLTAMDYSNADFAGDEYTPAYTVKIPKGEYTVKASLVDCGKGGYRIAAAKIDFSEENPIEFKMAVYENQDTSTLKEGYFYGFDIDTGFAIIADAAVLNEYCDILEKFEEENDEVVYPATEYYTANLEEKLIQAYDKYPDYNVDFIDYVVPETEHHMTFLSTGKGDGTYPVYFGYSKDGNLCCAVVQFIFTTEI